MRTYIYLGTIWQKNLSRPSEKRRKHLRNLENNSSNSLNHHWYRQDDSSTSHKNRYVQTDLVFIQKRIVKPSSCWGSAAVTANNMHHNRYTFVCVIEMNGAAKALCAMKYAKTSTLQSISKKQGSKVSNTHYAQKKLLLKVNNVYNSFYSFFWQISEASFSQDAVAPIPLQIKTCCKLNPRRVRKFLPIKACIGLHCHLVVGDHLHWFHVRYGVGGGWTQQPSVQAVDGKLGERGLRTCIRGWV